jgi:hypothetical protein
MEPSVGGYPELFFSITQEEVFPTERYPPDKIRSQVNLGNIAVFCS